MEIINSVFAFLNNPFILTPLGLAIGKYLKFAPWFNTKAVPFITVAAAVFVKLGDLLTKLSPPEVVPANFIAAANAATVSVDMLPAAFLGIGGFGGALLASVWGSVWQGAITTGLHSMPKNVKQWLMSGATMIVPKNERPK